MLNVNLAMPRGAAPNQIEVALRNDSEEPLDLLYWGTPLDPVTTDWLKVSSENGHHVRYIGPRAKYEFDPEHSLVRFAPGEIKTVLVDVTGHYDLPFSGAYQAILDAEGWRARPADKSGLADIATLAPVAAQTNATHVVLQRPWGKAEAPLSGVEEPQDLDPEALLKGPRCPPLIFCVPPRYHDAGYECRNGFLYITHPRFSSFPDQNRQLAVRRLSAELYARLYRYRVTNTPTFVRWFGPYSEESRATVQTVINGLQGETSCKLHHIVYVPNAPKPDLLAVFRRDSVLGGTNLDVMGLYPRYFTRPDFGIDSKIGTLAHELTHGYGETGDHAYGTAKCLDLARRDPPQAMNNADSYEYFLEETLLRTA